MHVHIGVALQQRRRNRRACDEQHLFLVLIHGLVCFMFELVLLVLPGMWCILQCLLEASFLILMDCGSTLAHTTRPFERTASIALHAATLALSHFIPLLDLTCLDLTPHLTSPHLASLMLVLLLAAGRHLLHLLLLPLPEKNARLCRPRAARRTRAAAGTTPLTAPRCVCAGDFATARRSFVAGMNAAEVGSTRG